jgi:hypothetical protein
MEVLDWCLTLLSPCVDVLEDVASGRYRTLASISFLAG